MKHILRAQQFDRSALERLFVETQTIRMSFQNSSGRDLLRAYYPDKTLLYLFSEPSTRTRISFQMAAVNLGMKTVGTESGKEFSSEVKGETLEHTIRVLCGYQPSVIVIRHKDNGAADRAASVSDKYNLNVPVVNAGDGTGQHPTQALLDLFTIQEKFGCIDGLTVVIGGDLTHGRTARSLAYLLSKFKVNLIFVSIPELTIGKDIQDHLHEKEIPFRLETKLEEALPEADVVYWTRFQAERAGEGITGSPHVITLGAMKLFKPEAILLHPLPIIGEIAHEVDDHAQAYYFRQAQNGMFVRMALLQDILS